MVTNLAHNARESAVNRVLDGSTYPRLKLMPSSLAEKIAGKNCNNVYLGSVIQSSD
jgi:hypothetical protein